MISSMKKINKTVDVVVVTFNRLELLKKCLKSILNQTYPIKNIFVIDNNSTDNTMVFLQQLSNRYPKIIPVHLSRNIGGAGGFYEGLKLFIQKSHSDYVWIMDDDTIPSVTALEKIVKRTADVSNFGFLTGNVRWKDGKSALMNIPEPITNWNEKADKGLVGVDYASFVAIMFPRNVVLKVGLPIKDFFIWGDDVEYTKRITQKGFKGYAVIDSLVYHETKKNIGSNIVLEEDSNRIRRYYYARRNTIFTMKNRYNKKEYIKWLVNSMIFEPIRIIRFADNRKIFRLRMSLKGTISGLFFKPKIEKLKDNTDKNE